VTRRSTWRVWVLPAILLWAFEGAGFGTVVEGVLRGVDGRPAAGVAFYFTDQGGNLVGTVVTDLSGAFRVAVDPGSYEIRTSLDRSAGPLAELAVGRRPTLRMDLQLPDGSGAAPPEPREEQSSAADSERALETIGDLDRDWGYNLPDDVLEAVNPFSYRKQGRFYGSLYEFHRNDNLDARNFFDPVGEPLPEYKRNQFGATFGLRVSPDLALQGAYDGLRIAQGSTLLAHIPTAEMKRGDFSAAGFVVRDPLTGEPFAGNRIPEDRINPVARRLLDVLPDPNRADPDRNFVNNDPIVRNQNHLNVRVDWQRRPRTSLSGEYYYTGVKRNQVRAIPQFGSEATERHQEGSLAYDRTLNERLSIYSRVEVGRNRSMTLSQNAGRAGLLASLGIEGLELLDPLEEGYPAFYLTGYANFGDVSSPDIGIRNRVSWDGSLTYATNRHTLDGGVALDYDQLNNYQSDGLHRGSFSFTGDYSGDAFGDLLLGYVKTADRGIGSNRADLRRLRWEVFFRDRWRISPRFETTLGVSYRLTPPYHSIANNVSTLYPLILEPPPAAEVVVAGSERAKQLGFTEAGTLIFPDCNDWAPNIAVAYAPLGNNRLVFRSSYSIWYDSPGDWTFIRSLTRNYPFYYVQSVEAGTERIIPLHDAFSEVNQPELTFESIEPHLKNPMTHSWRLAMESELSSNWSLEIAYQGRRGVNVLRRIPANVPAPGPGTLQERRPSPNFGRLDVTTSGSSSWGHTLDISAERRLADGVSLQSGFDWNRFLDENPSGDPQNPRDLRAEKATVSWIPRRRLYLNYIVDLPLDFVSRMLALDGWAEAVFQGWRLSGITQIQDGRPLTVRVPGDPNNDGVYGDRPDRIGDGALPPSQRNVDAWFDTTAFAPQPAYGFGNSGRNILLGPPYQSWDISVIKNRQLKDGERLELRVELFNAFNHVNFDAPDTEYGSDLFGKVFGAGRAREIEVALKYTF